MKLNKKGQQKIIDWAEDLIRASRGENELPDDFELTQDDFEDCVVFNIEEADDMRYEFKILTEAMGDLNYEFGTRFHTDEAWEKLKLLKERIEQAEGKCSSE